MKKILLLIIVCIVQTGVVFSQNWDKYLDKYQGYIENADYGKAQKTNAKLEKKTSQKLGKDNKYIGHVMVNNAEMTLLQGQLLNFDKLAQKALVYLPVVAEKHPDTWNQLVVKSAQLYCSYGNYILADSLIEDYLANGKMNDAVYFDAYACKINGLIGSNKYPKAIEMADTAIYLIKSYLPSVQNADVKSKLNSTLALYIITKSEALLSLGFQHKADSTLKSNIRWINSNIEKNSGVAVQAHIVLAKIYEIGDETKEAEKEFESAYSSAVAGRKNNNPLVLQAYDELIRAYIRFDKSGRAKTEIKNLETLIKNEYGKNSALQASVVLLDLERNKYEQSIVSYEGKIKSLINNKGLFPEHHILKLKAQQYLYDVLVGMHKHKDALQVLDAEIEGQMALKGYESIDLHLALMKKGAHLLKHTNELQKADSIFTVSWFGFLVHEIGPDHDQYIEVLRNLAEYYKSKDEFEKANEMLNEAAVKAKRLYSIESISFANLMVSIADLQIDMGAVSDASRYLKLAEETLYKNRNQDNNLIYYANMLASEARLSLLKGDFEEAESFIKAAKKSFEKAVIKDEMDKEKANAVLTSIYIRTGLYNEADNVLKQAIKVNTNSFGVYNKKLIIPLVMRGVIKLQQGEYTEAEKFAREAMNLTRSLYGDNNTRMVPVLELYSDVSKALGDEEKALEYLNKAIAIYESKLDEDHFLLANLYTSKGVLILSDKSQLQKAMALFEKSEINILKELDDASPMYADLLEKKAWVFIKSEQYPKAFEQLLKAEGIWTARVGKRNNINAAQINVLLGDVFYMLKNFKQASINYTKAKGIFEKYFSENHPEYVQTLAKLSKNEFMLGNQEVAMKLIEEVLDNYFVFIENFFPSLSEREKAKYWNSIKGDFEYYNTLVIKQIVEPDDKLVGKIYNNALNTKALLLNASIKVRETIQSSDDNELKKLFNSWLVTKEQLTQSLSMMTNEVQARVDVDSLSQLVNNLEKQLSARSNAFQQLSSRKIVLWEDVKSVLKENEVAIELVRFRLFDHVFSDSVIYAAITLSNDGRRDRPNLILLKNGKELEQKYFSYYRNNIIYQQHDELSYKQFWQPIESHISKSASIYLSPDGVFNQINLEAIPISEGDYIIDHANIILVSNTKDLYYFRTAKPNTQKTENSVMLFGDPDFYVTTKPVRGPNTKIVSNLPGTSSEVKNLSDLFAEHEWVTHYFLKQNAGEEIVKQLVSPKVFHVATHGFYSKESKEELDEVELEGVNSAVNNPLLRSGLLLTGAGDVLAKYTHNYNTESGILTAYEAMNLHLEGTELVVLSACETGLGDVEVGEGVYGLQRAFLVAGAKTLIMSLFKVNDQTTNELMVSFYDKWLATGDKRESFMQAKKEIRAKYKDPIYWGAFIMYGVDE